MKIRFIDTSRQSPPAGGGEVPRERGGMIQFIILIIKVSYRPKGDIF